MAGSSSQGALSRTGRRALARSRFAQRCNLQETVFLTLLLIMRQAKWHRIKVRSETHLAEQTHIIVVCLVSAYSFSQPLLILRSVHTALFPVLRGWLGRI